MSMLDGLFGVVRTIYNGGTELPARAQLRLLGDLSAIDNSSNGRTEFVLRATTVAALSVTPGLYDGQYARTECYTTRGDGGGGTFVWDEDDVTTANGGTILGTGTGRWRRVYMGFASPKWFGAKGDGSTDDTTAMRACILACDHVDFADSTYIVTSDLTVPCLSLTSRSGVHWRGRGSTLKVKNNTAITGFSQILKLTSCADFEAEGVTFDGNTSNRDTSGGSAVGSGAHAIEISGGSNLRFRNLLITSSGFDGIYVRASSVGTEATYPYDVLVENCTIYAARRNGISLIGCKRVTVRGGRIYGTTGDPGAGIDIEPNASDTYGVEDTLIEGVMLESNAGEGIVVTGANSSVRPKRTTIKNIRGRNNTKALVYAVQCESTVIDGVHCADDTTNPTRAGIVMVGTNALRTKVRGCTFRNVTALGTGKFCVYIDDTNPGSTVSGIEAYNCSGNVVGVSTGSSASVSDVHMDTITGGDYGISLGATVSRLSNVFARNVTGRVIQMSGTVNVVEGVTIEEPSTSAQAIRVVQGRTVIRHVSVYESGNAAGSVYPIYFDNAATIDVLEGVYCKAAGTDYTRANAIRLPTSCAGARVRNVFPNPFANTATWDPASLASGSSVTSSSITVTGAELGDPVRTSHSVDLQGLVSTGYVSAANTVKVVLSNLTGGAVDLASHTVTVEVIK